MGYHVTVIHSGDDDAYVTKDSSGTVADVVIDPVDGAQTAMGVEAYIEFDAAPDSAWLVVFSWVDYRDTSMPAGRSESGVRQRIQRLAPTQFDTGPYLITVTEA